MRVLFLICIRIFQSQSSQASVTEIIHQKDRRFFCIQFISTNQTMSAFSNFRSFRMDPNLLLRYIYSPKLPDNSSFIKCHKLCCQFFCLKDLIFDRTDKCQFQDLLPDLQISAIGFPVYPRSSTFLFSLIHCFPFVTPGFMPGLCTWLFPAKCIDKSRLSDIRDSDYHRTDRTVQNPTLSVTFHLSPYMLPGSQTGST